MFFDPFPRRHLFIALLSCILLAACSPLKTEVESDPGFAAAGYRQVAWATPPLGERSGADMRRIDHAVRTAVEAELGQRGYRMAEEAAAELLIDYRLSQRIEPAGAGAVSPTDEAARMWDLDPTPAGDSALYRHPVAGSNERAELFLNLRDRRSGRLVWQGRVSGVFAAEDQGDRRALIRRAAARLLRQLPAANS
jgi:hypothetical protein